MAEIYLTDDEEITISKQKCSINYVRERFKKITDNHILWVIHNILETRSEVRNMKAYLLAALYNAPLTADIGNRQRIRGIVLRKFDGLE